MPPVIPTRYLEISGISMSIVGAWMLIDYTPLLQDAEQRGDDRLVPHLPGRIAHPRRRDRTAVVLPMEIYGDNDQTGAAHANQVDGLEANIAYLNANVVAPVSTGDGTRAAVLHLPAGNRNANVHVVGLGLSRTSPTTARASLKLNIPTGRFA